MARLFADWESMLRGRSAGAPSPGWPVESTIALVKALWEGDVPMDAFLDDALRERLSEITQRKNALPRVLALAPRELASRLAAVASRDTKLLPMLASPTRATLEGLAKSHGSALLEDVRPGWVDVADPLWLAWYAGALGRVMGGMQATSTVVPPAEPVEAKDKSEAHPSPVVKRAPAKARSEPRATPVPKREPETKVVGSRTSGVAIGGTKGGAVKVSPPKPSRPMPKIKK